MTAIALAACATGAGCGGGEPSSREQVEAYLREANAVQARFSKSFAQANEAYRDFAQQVLTGEDAVQSFAQVREDVADARERLGELQAPAPARSLHSQLVRLYDMNVDFAEQSVLLAAYQVDSAAAVAPLGRIDARLQRRLRGERVPARQAAALARFSDGIGRTLDDLEELDPPRVLAPAHGDQVRRLQRTRSLARRLEAALRAQDARDVASLLKRFRANARPSRARKRLSRRAIVDYNRRYRHLNDAYSDLSREHAELDRSLD